MPNSRAAAAERLPAHLPTGLSTGQVAGLDLARLTQAVRGFSVDQLLWSSGYLAGLAAAGQALTGAEPATAPAGAPASESARLTILYASQTGNARSVAESLGRQAAARNLAHRVVSAADLRPRDLAKERLLLLVVSTQGEGEPPESAVELYRYLHGRSAPDLAGLRYGVFGLGDSSYEHFCKAARDFDARLAELGARRLLERVEADLDFRPVSETWFPAALERVESELPPAGRPRDAEIVPLRPLAPVRHERDNPYRAQVLDHRPLTTPGAVTQVRHLALAVDPAALPYAPGDALGVRFRNDPALVAQVLGAVGLSGESEVSLDGTRIRLGDALAERLELTRLHPAVVAAWAGIAADPRLAALAADREAVRAYCRQHQVVDLLGRFPARPEAAGLAGLLQPIQPRLYSIASAPAETEDEIHLTVATLRYELDGGERLGGASGYLAERIEAGDDLDVYVAENPGFRLPQDGSTPIVLVGAGTGVAPFRAFLQQRAAQGDRGPNWLVFGNRHFHRDFLYQSDWLRLRKAGVLHRFSPAFSRDPQVAGSGRAYVQDRLRAEGRELWRWLAEGARIYVCGATAMEAGVRDSLAAVAREQGGLAEDAAAAYLDTLRSEGRYLRDTY